MRLVTAAIAIVGAAGVFACGGSDSVEPGTSAGGISITTVTAGGLPIDSWEYGLTVDGETAAVIGLDATLRIGSLADGPHALALTGIARNCAVDGPVTRTVTAVTGKTARETFSVSCTQAEPAGRGRQIAFAFRAPRHEPAEIHLVNDDGTGLIRLTENTVLDRGPTWSPDGATLAFWSLLTGTAEIFVIEADAGAASRTKTTSISMPDGAAWPVWSPDGSSILVLGTFEGRAGLWEMNPDGSNRRFVFAGADGGSWSPDGTRLVLSMTGGGIAFINRDGSGLTPVNPPGGHERDVMWSPDGGRILYSAEADGHRELFVMNADGTGGIRLTASAAREVGGAPPSW